MGKPTHVAAYVNREKHGKCQLFKGMGFWSKWSMRKMEKEENKDDNER